MSGGEYLAEYVRDALADLLLDYLRDNVEMAADEYPYPGHLRPVDGRPEILLRDGDGHGYRITVALDAEAAEL